MNKKRTVSCAVPQCILQFEVERHLFRFPKEHDRWLQWVRASGRSDLEPKGPEYSHRNMRLCHLHFEEKWYKINKVYARLHPDAVPTIFFEPHFKDQDNTNEATQMGVEKNVFKEEELNEITQMDVEESVFKEEEELNEITQMDVEESVFKQEEELSEITQTEVEESVFKQEEEELSEITQTEVEESVFKQEEEELNEITQTEVEKSVFKEELNEIIQTEVEKSVFKEEELNEITQMEVEKNVSKEELHKNICGEVAIQVEKKNSIAETKSLSAIILSTCHSAVNNLQIAIIKPATSAEKSNNVTTHTKKLLDESARQSKITSKLLERIKKLQTKIRTLQQTIRRLRMKAKKKELIVTNEQDDYNNLKKLGQKLLPENFNRILAAQIDAQLKRKTGRRYDAEFKKFALSLYFLSPQNYKELQNSIALPSIRSLQLFTKKLNFVQ